MDKKLSINVSVAGRKYALSLTRGDEAKEETIRKAASLINDRVLLYKEKFADKDTQDFLAMSSLQFVAKLIESEKDNDIEPLINKIKDLTEELEELNEE